MFKNYLLVSIRNLIRNKVYSTINIIGLVVGTVASILTFAFVSYETSFDKFWSQSENIYRVSLQKFQNNVESIHSATTYTALSAILKENFPEIEASTRLSQEDCLIRYEDEKKFGNQRILWADASFFEVFPMTFIEGSLKEALTKPNTGVISKKTAAIFFGNDNPIGKTVILNEGLPFLITGVVENLPQNSHLKFDFIMSLRTGYSQGWASEAGDWKYNWIYTYFRVKNHLNKNDFEQKINDFIKNNDLSQKNESLTNVYHLQSVESIHLDSELNSELNVNGNRRIVYIMGIISIFILIIAWINFINLSTARAMERAKETGIRKITGAERSQLIGQFLIESAIINLFSGIIALLIARSMLPYFSELLNRPLETSIWENLPFWSIYVLLFIAGSLIAGIYPALVLSSFNPLHVLKTRSKYSTQGSMFRKVLVVFQFSISIILITATLVIYLQFRHMQHTNTGVNYKQVLVINAPRTLNMDPARREKFASFKQQILAFHSIKEVSASNPIPGKELWSFNDEIKRLSENESKHQTYSMLAIDNSFIPLYEINLLAGENFSPKFEVDSNNVIINEKAAQALGYKATEEAVNDKIVVNGKTFTIKGVCNDYFQEGMKKQVSPAFFFHTYDYLFGFYSVRLDGSNLDETLAYIKNIWENNFPKDPFDYFFADEMFAAHYEQEQQAGKVFAGFSLLTIIIACLGLLGLVSYLAERRNKEIGLRKVLGASGSSLFILLSKDFALLIGIAICVGLPLSYIFMDSWLANYPLRISLDVGIFLIPIFALVLSALFITGFTILKAAFSNPSNALRYE